MIYFSKMRVRDEQQVAAFDSTHRDYFDYDVSICDVPRIHVFFKITGIRLEFQLAFKIF